MGDLHLQKLTVSETPLRKINIRSSVRRTGFTTSRKRPGVGIDWESSFEEAFVLRAELDPLVDAVFEQPTKIRYWNGSNESYTIVDFAIRIGGRVELHEVKPDDKAERSEERDRFRMIAEMVERLDSGFAYSLTLGSTLTRQPQLKLLRQLDRHRLKPCDELLRLAVIDIVNERSMPVGEILDMPGARRPRFEDVLKLVAQNDLLTEMHAPIDRDTVVHGWESGFRPARLIPFSSPLEHCA